LVLDERWLNFQENSFFFDFLRILRGQISISRSWKEEIRKAAILAGESQCSSDLPQAFLWNMIAIELLLTKQGDRYLDSLPERAEAFIGWTVDWKQNNYRELIKDLYRKRCQLVHSGNKSAIEVQDLLFSDEILLNVLTNIVKHPRLFKSKDDVITFSEKVKAEYVLGINPRTRPKTLRFSRPTYDSTDLEHF
jgi:hypothetical protein